MHSRAKLCKAVCFHVLGCVRLTGASLNLLTLYGPESTLGSVPLPEAPGRSSTTVLPILWVLIFVGQSITDPRRRLCLVAGAHQFVFYLPKRVLL